MTNKDITKIYFRGNEIVALYKGDTLIFKKSGGGSTTEPTGVYTVRGTVNPFSGEQSIQLCVNGKQEQFNVNSDNTFEHTFVNVPVTNMDYFTQPCRNKLKTIDLSNFDTSQVTSMIQAFYQCNKLETIDLTNIDTSKVSDTGWLFSGCSSLQTLDLSSLDTSKVTSMRNMFSSCRNLKSLDVSKFNTSKVTDMLGMFEGCNNLTSLDVSNFDTSNVKSMLGMFKDCNNLTLLDVSNFDTSNVESMSHMFSSCRNLKSLDVSKFNTSKVTDMSLMFLGNWNITLLDVSNFDTSNVKSMHYMFEYVSKLTDLYMNFDVRLNKNFTDIFVGCNKLTNVVGKFEGTKYDLDLSSCSLTAASAMVFINGLATVAEKRTLKLSATTYDSLTTEQIAIATSKGWTVTRS